MIIQRFIYFLRFPIYVMVITNKLLVGIFVFCIFLCSTVYAGNSILVAEEEVKEVVFAGETAVFKLSISNSQNFDDSFRFSILNIDWEFETDPFVLSVDSEDIEVVEMRFSPSSKLGPGKHGVTVLIYSLSDETVFTEHIFDIRVIDFYDVISTTLELPNDINPQKQLVIKAILENNYDEHLEDLTFKLESDFFQDEINFSLAAYETQVSEFSVDFEGDVEEGVYDIVLKIYNGEDLLLENTVEMLVGYYPDVDETRSPESGFLLNRILVTKTNHGTSTSHELYTKRFSFFERLFTSTDPQPDQLFSEGGYYTLQWEFDLSPGDTRQIFIETNYRFFAILVSVLLILLYFFYNYFKRDVSLTKKVVTVKHSQEGISTMNILLVLKNKTNKTLKNLKVMDNLVNVAGEPTNFGTISPSVVKRGHSGARMMWNIESLEKGAEVIISYQAKCKVQVIGHLNIPTAVAKYIKNGRPIVVKSNKVKLFS